MAKQNPRQYNEDIIRQQQQQQEINKELLVTLREQNTALKEQFKDREASAAQEEYLLSLTSKSSQLTKQLSKFTREDLSNKRKRAQLEQLQSDAMAEQKVLQEKAKKAYAEVDKLTGKQRKAQLKIAETLKDQEETVKESLEQAKLLGREFNRFDKATSFFDHMSDTFAKIPVIGKMFKGFSDMAKEASDIFKKTGSVRQSIMGGLGKGTQMGINAIITALIAGIGRGLGQLDDLAVKLQRGLNLSKGAAEGLTSTLVMSKPATMSLEQMTQSAIGLSNALQSAAPGSAATLRTVFTLSEKLGLSAEEAGNLYKFSTLTGESFRTSTAAVVGQVAALNIANKSSIRFGDVLKDISNASAATLMNASKFPGGIEKAAFQARKLGLSLNAVASAGSSLLNFEESISAELEAELLTGKQLNLQKAREAALMDDQATLAEEISKNIGSAADFRKMNVLQQEAVAKAVGLERNEVAKSLMQREALLALEKETGIAGLHRLEQQEQINKLTEENVKSGLSKEEARRKALVKLGENELAAQERSMTVQESLNRLLGQIAETLGQLIALLTGLENPLSKITEFTQSIADGQQGILGDQIRGQKLQADIEKEAAAVSNKKLQAAGISREKYKELLEYANLQQGLMGLAGTVPEDVGFSDYFRLGFTGNKRIRESRARLNEIDNLQVNDFTIRTNPKDTLVMAGGTKLGDETNMLLKELITAVKSGGHVYLDGNKVGQSLVLSTYKTT